MYIRNTLLPVPVSIGQKINYLFTKGEWNVELKQGLGKLWLWYLFFLNGKVLFKMKL